MNPTGAMNHLTRAVPNRPYPVVSAKSFGTGRMSGSGLEPIQPMMQAIPMGQPVMMFPTYGNYGTPYMYVTHNLIPVQPYYYAPIQPIPQQPVRRFSTSSYRKNATSFASNQEISGTSPHRSGIIDNRMFNGIRKFGYAESAQRSDDFEDDTLSVESETSRNETLSFLQLSEMIDSHFARNLGPLRLSYLNRLLVASSNEQEFQKCLDTLDKALRRSTELTPETGTLLIKAACRAGVPHHALTLLNDVDNVRLWPTLGGIHYLMINFALKKDTKAIFQTLEVAKKRQLKPTTKTFHILVRECVDNGLVEEAAKVLEECMKSGVSPNRTTYNILMNGLRKLGKAQDMLSLRKLMDDQKVEINDTTVKFTTLAYMMERDTAHALQEFMKFPDVSTRMEEVCEKFLEIAAEKDSNQTKVVIDLFDAIRNQGNPPVPASIQGRLAQFQTA